MSTFEDSNYEWRETYFVLLLSDRRPAHDKVVKALRELNDSFEITNERPDSDGQLGSLSLRAPNESAAMDIGYFEGEEATEQIADLQKQLEPLVEDDEERRKLGKIPTLNARIDILHFERIGGAWAEEDEEDEFMLDPAALLSVLECLIKLTHGIGVDPQSSTLY